MKKQSLMKAVQSEDKQTIREALVYSTIRREVIKRLRKAGFETSSKATRAAISEEARMLTRRIINSNVDFNNKDALSEYLRKIATESGV